MGKRDGYRLTQASSGSYHVTSFNRSKIHFPRVVIHQKGYPPVDVLASGVVHVGVTQHLPPAVRDLR